MTQAKLTIGTRGSPLALAQTHDVRDRLIAAHPELAEDGAVVVEVIDTTGDKIQDRALSEIGGKGLFTKELDDAMYAGRIDLAVHSMKDVPTWLPDGIVLPCILEREDVRDAFICNTVKSFMDLPQGAVIGSASLRRGAQILNKRPDLKVVNFRGNVQTRLRKLNEGQVDATLLAMAGLNRLGMAADIPAYALSPDDLLPAVAQGAVGVTCRADDEAAHKYLSPLAHQETTIRADAERALLAELDGSCRTPIAALAEFQADGAVRFRGLVVSPDGKVVHRDEATGTPDEIVEIAADMGRKLKATAGPDFFTDV